MYIFIDESGDFSSGLSMVCSLIIPDTIEGYIKRRYREFENTIPDEELSNGEVKGANLSFRSRLRFFEFLNQYKEIRITPTSTDLDIQPKKELDDFFKMVNEGYSAEISKAISNKDEKRRKILVHRLNTYKKDQSLFIHQVMIVHNIYKTMEHLLVYYLNSKYDFCFEHISIVIDKKNIHGLTDYERLTRDAMPMFISNLSRKNPLGVVADVWGPDHPFRRNYEIKEGVDSNKLARDVQFKDSKRNHGLRMADIVCNSFYKCLKGGFSDSQTRLIYRGIINNIATGSKIGPNFVILGKEEEETIKVPKKYLQFYKYDLFSGVP